MEQLRNVIRSLVESISVASDGSMSDDNSIDVMVELVDEYIKKNAISSQSRYGKAHDYVLPYEAKEYFDHLGFKQYKEVMIRDRKPGSAYVKRIVVEFWYGDPV